jgi:dUTP pyrophosphatase
MKLRIQKMDWQATLPTRGTPNSVGLDLHAFLISESGRPNKALIPPKSTRAIGTRLIVEPPEGYAVYVCSRSGLAKNLSLFVTNAPGVVDPDYRGEIVVLLYNGGHEAQYIEHGQRIAQMVMLATPILEIEEAVIDTNTLRGDAGFGSTGR